MGSYKFRLEAEVSALHATREASLKKAQGLLHAAVVGGVDLSSPITMSAQIQVDAETVEQAKAAVIAMVEQQYRGRVESLTLIHAPRCWGATSYSGEMAHCFCGAVQGKNAT